MGQGVGATRAVRKQVNKQAMDGCVTTSRAGQGRGCGSQQMAGSPGIPGCLSISLTWGSPKV